MDKVNIEDCQVGDKSWVCPVSTCKKSLSRKQTLRTHLLSQHGIDDCVPCKKYKMYEVDPNAEIPKRTAIRIRQKSQRIESEQGTSDLPDGDVTESGNESDKNENENEHGQSSGSEIISDDDNDDDAESCMEESCHETEKTSENGDSENQDTMRYGPHEIKESNISDMEMASNNSWSSDKVESEVESSSEFDATETQKTTNKLTESECHQSAPLYVIQNLDRIYEAPISYREHLLSVCAYVSRHNCSDTEFRDLLSLLNLHIPTNNLIETDVDKVKLICGFDKTFLTYHFYCSVCKKVFNKDIDQCQTGGCSGNQEFTKNYFVTGNLQKQLSDVLTRPEIWQSVIEQSSVSLRSITDITNGTGYRELKGNGQFLSEINNVTLSMFTDGIPLFKSSGVSLWPVYLLINEIPRKQRFLRKNMILWGVWQGAGKPNMTMFLSPLVQDLNSLYSEGLKLIVSGHEVLIKAKLILVTMDLQARASVLHMTQHNGQFPCNFCMIPGEVVASGKGHTRAFIYEENGSEERLNESIRQDAKLAQQQKKKINGFTGESVLLYLHDFSLNTNVAVDYMHGILLGITKKLLTLWTDSSKSDKPFYIGKHMKVLDKAIKSIYPPYMISRLPRKLSAKDHWKASEFRSWLLFYAIPCLKGKLEETYLVHFSTLVEATYILLGEGISEEDLQHANSLLCGFMRHTEALYGKAVMGLNFHNLIHLVPCVRKWGPLWAWSCFCFENFNGELKKTVHGTGNVCRQIFWAMQVQKKLETENIKDDGQFGEFVRNMTETSVLSKNGEEYYQCVVPERKPLDEIFSESVKESLTVLGESCVLTDYEKSKKIIRNGFQMYSKTCTRVRRRNSYTLQLIKPLQDGTCAIEVDHYILNKNTRQVFAVGKKLKPISGVLRNRVPHLQMYEYCRNVREAVKATDLDKVLVVMEIDDIKCFGAMPNTIEKD